MYTRYFGFNEKPFTLTPNPRFIFLGRHHREAFAHILYGINNHCGFIELIGEVGTGKTTVLRTLLGQLQDETHRCALIFNPCLTSLELVRSINQEYGIDASSDCVGDLLHELNGFLLEQNRLGRTVVLVIDEAQNLRTDILEHLRLISNLETENDKLIQIVLAGQPELETLLRRQELRQLNQRIAVRYRLGPLERSETGRYIRHRLEMAGAGSGVTFSSAALFCVQRYSRGVPRLINILCDRALLIAYGDERRRVSVAMVIRAIGELIGTVSVRPFLLAGLTAVLLLVIAALTVGHLVSVGDQERGTVPATGTASRRTAAIPPATAALLPTPQGSPIERELRRQALNDVHLPALNAILNRWDAQPVRSFRGNLASLTTFAHLAARRELNCTPFRGKLNDAIRFNLPFLMVTRVSDGSGRPYCLAVTAVNGDSVSVSPLPAGRAAMGRESLAGVAQGTYYLFWRNRGRIPHSLRRGEKSDAIGLLQQQLSRAGFYSHPIEGEYDGATVMAVRRFQQSRGIAVNDAVGELTLALLSRLDGEHRTPALNGTGQIKKGP